MAINLNDLDLPSGDWLDGDDKTRMWEQQEPFFIIGGEPKVRSTIQPVKDNGEPNFNTIFTVIIRTPEGEEEERLLSFGHSRPRENLCVAAVQADDKIGPCYLHKGPPPKPGFSGVWLIKGEKDPAMKGGGKTKGKGADVPWGDDG